jgi:hypothetical protein
MKEESESSSQGGRDSFGTNAIKFVDGMADRAKDVRI